MSGEPAGVDPVEVRRQAEAWRAALADLGDETTRGRGLRTHAEVALHAAVVTVEALSETGENDR